MIIQMLYIIIIVCILVLITKLKTGVNFGIIAYRLVAKTINAWLNNNV